MTYWIAHRPTGAENEPWFLRAMTWQRDEAYNTEYASYYYLDTMIITKDDDGSEICRDLIPPDEEMNRKNDGRWMPDDWQGLKGDEREDFIRVWCSLPREDRLPWLNEWRAEHGYHGYNDEEFPPAKKGAAKDG